MSGGAPLDDAADLLAAEYAFGLLDDAERTAAARPIARDAAFAGAVARWQDHAAALAAGGEIAPPAAIWSRIEARMAANDGAVVPTNDGGARPWRIATAIASAAALVFGVVLVEQPRTQPAAAAPAPSLVAVLTAPSSDTTLIVEIQPAARRVVSAPARLTIGAHAAQLWVIPAGGKPVSLGVIPAERPGSLTIASAAAAMLAPGATVAVSMEPRGGSPTGQPTGPVLATGKLASL